MYKVLPSSAIVQYLVNLKQLSAKLYLIILQVLNANNINRKVVALVQAYGTTDRRRIYASSKIYEFEKTKHTYCGELQNSTTCTQYCLQQI